MEGNLLNSQFFSPLLLEFTFLSGSMDYWGIKENAVTLKCISSARGCHWIVALCGDHGKESVIFVQGFFFLCVFDAVLL